MNLADAKSAIKFAKVLRRDAQGRIISIEVPGHEGKTYEVILRHEQGGLTTECLLSTGNGYLPCQGNGHALCYHSLSAILFAASEKQISVKVCQTKAATKIKNVYDEAWVFPIRSRQSGKEAYVVMEVSE